MRKVVLVLMSLCLTLGLFAEGQKDAGDDTIKIGVSIPTQSAERWVRDKVQIEEEALKRGMDVVVQVANEDSGKQINQCENMLAMGIDVLILAPHDAKGAAAIVESAQADKVPVISYDRLVMDCEPELYLSFDNFKVGEIQGKYITEMVPSGDYVLLAGAPTDNNATLFKAGAMTYIQPLIDAGRINVVAEQAVKDWQPVEALKIMENALTASGNKVDAVLAPNDGTAGAAIEALAAQGMDGLVPVTGQDAEVAAAQRIVQGTQAMTVFKDTRMLAVKAVELAEMLAKSGNVSSEINNAVDNGRVDVPSVLLTPIAVDKNNVKEVLVDSGYVPASILD